MKYDLNKPLTKGINRTLEIFKDKMILLLSLKSFEEITISELCELTSYPRSTFYNYFEDKYDLLNYCWISLSKDIKLDEYYHAKENEMLFIYFDRIYDFTKNNNEIIHKILKNNTEVGYMFSSFRNFLNNYMRLIFKNCPDAKRKSIPNELLADQYSNTLFLLWQYIAIKDPSCSKENAHKYLHILLDNIIENTK